MNAWVPALQATALSLSLLWLLLALTARPRSPLSIVWALFCGSIAMLMARGLAGPEAGSWYQLFGLGACLTCNGFWLVARALFRDGRPFHAPHLIYAGTVAVLIMLTQQQTAAPAAVIAIAGELLQLLSSAALVMAFWEGLRGWQQHAGVERGMRLVFLTTYGGCVVASFVAPAVVDAQGVGTVKAASAAAASAAILLVTQGLVAWRLRHPLRAHDRPQDGTGLALDMGAERSPADVAAQDDPHADSPISPEDIALAHALEQYMRLHRPYLHADLKLSHLAQALDVGEYRISRAVHGPLGNRNVSHYINGFRLDLARTLLADRSHDHWSVLVIALESGFGSLGAFHRAFKASEGCTPGEYRAEQQSSGAVPSAI